MSRALFGTDGVRGIAGEYPLDQDGATQIGRAVGTYFAEAGQSIVLACDPRESSDDLMRYVSNGLTSVGVNVVSIGVIPTPGLAYITRENDGYVAGVMITASHNPREYNGIKVFDKNGDKLSDAVEAELNSLIENGVDDRQPGQKTDNKDLIKSYEDFLVGSAGDFRLDGVKLAVDSANGAASGLAGRVFGRLGAKVTSLFDAPDGKNINAQCGATDTNALAAQVVEQNLDLGIALDGDADRLVMIDGRGREVRGDYILYILALSAGLKGVVVTVMSNLGFSQSLERQGIVVEKTAVGDRYVLEGLAKTGYLLGGEQSGHIIFYDLLKTGDGLLAAVKTVKAVAESKRTLAEWCDEVELLPQALVNIPLKNKQSLENPEVKKYLEGLTSEFGNTGRVFIRASGTEPLARVMVEAPQAEAKAKAIAEELQKLIASLGDKS